MESKHTKGPWKYTFDGVKKDWACVSDSTGGIIANVNTETGPDLSPLVSRKMPAEANAQLIASAPNMLEALKLFANCPLNCEISLKHCREQALEAINKAEGG